MKHRKLFSWTPVLLLVLLLSTGCGAPVTKANSPKPTSTRLTGTSIPTPGETPTPTPQVTTVLLPVNLAEPLVLQGDQTKFTVTAVGPIVGNWAYIQPTHQNDYQLLQVAVTIKNLTNTQIWFSLDPNTFEEQGSASDYKHLNLAFGLVSTETLVLQDSKGIKLNVGGDKGAGQGSPVSQFSAGNYYSSFSIQPAGSIQVEIAFVAPKQATQFRAGITTVHFQ